MVRQLRSRAPQPRSSRRLRVAVDWCPVVSSAAQAGHVELVAELAAGKAPVWSRVGPGAMRWEDEISASGCEEVVLTTWLRGQRGARDWVLDLAERLTQRLAKSQPLIRVRFMQEA